MKLIYNNETWINVNSKIIEETESQMNYLTQSKKADPNSLSNMKRKK